MNCTLREDTPQSIIESLKCLIGETGTRNQKCVENEDWPFDLLGTNTYYALDGESTLRREVSNVYYLSVHMSIKDYHGEVDQFLCWIAPYSTRNGFVGYKYHQDFDMPSLIFFEESKVFLIEIEAMSRTELTRKRAAEDI